MEHSDRHCIHQLLLYFYLILFYVYPPRLDEQIKYNCFPTCLAAIELSTAVTYMYVPTVADQPLEIFFAAGQRFTTLFFS